MPYKVFVSYSWSNSAERRALSSEISDIEGVEVLVDRDFIRPGDPIHERVNRMITDADCVVVLLTEEGLKSTEVLDEISRVHDRGKLIIPVVAESTTLEMLPWYVRDLLSLPYNERNFDEVIDKVVERVRTLAEPLSTIDQSKIPSGLKELLDSGAQFVDVPMADSGHSRQPSSVLDEHIFCTLKLRQSDAVFVFRAHVTATVGAVAEYLAHYLLPHLYHEDYVWLLVREDEPRRQIPTYLSLATADIGTGDTVLLLGNHRRPEWAPSQA